MCLIRISGCHWHGRSTLPDTKSNYRVVINNHGCNSPRLAEMVISADGKPAGLRHSVVDVPRIAPFARALAGVSYLGTAPASARTSQDLGRHSWGWREIARLTGG